MNGAPVCCELRRPALLDDSATGDEHARQVDRGRQLVRGAEGVVAEVNRHTCLWIAMVSVVVSIQMRRMFGEVRKMFVHARHAEQDVREGRRVGTSEPNSCSYEAA